MDHSDFDTKSLILIFAICYLFVLWGAILVAPAFIRDVNLFKLVDILPFYFEKPFALQWTVQTPKVMGVFSLLYTTGVGVYFSNRRKTRHGIEHGSAVWGEVKKICKKYADPPDRILKKVEKRQNILLTRNFRIGLDGYKHQRNLNVLVVGGSGAGKTRFYAKPNVMQANCSFVITDPKSEILRSTGHVLKANGYKIRVLDLINHGNSFGYNPFAYLHSDNDVLKLIENLVKATSDKEAQKGEKFWENTETMLLQALMLYLYHEAPEDERNFPMVLELLRNIHAKEEDEEYLSPADVLFLELACDEPDHIAVKLWQQFKHAAGKTAKSILISADARLQKFTLPDIERLSLSDEMNLASLGEEKTALFCCIPDTDASLNFLVSMLYTQMFQTLYYQADHKYNGRLPVHVHCIMDEFANIALPDDFERFLATMRSREISVSIIIQNIAQLKTLFRENRWESVVGNCDHFLYLGGNELSTHEYVSKLLGKETIDTNTYGQSKGRNGSYSTNYQQAGRELKTPDEVRMLKNSDALLFIRGERPLLDKKYNIRKHPNIALTTDGRHNPYVYETESPLSKRDIHVRYDEERSDDYEVLFADEIEAEEI